MSQDTIVEEYVKNPIKQQKLYKKTLTVVIISQIFGGAGLAAGITVGALLAEEMLGTDAVGGLPSALFTLGSALAAFMVGRLSNQFGRRTGLATGFIVGGVGAIGVIFAAIFQNIFLLFIALFVYGSGISTNLQARYAGTDLATKEQRGKAISIAMVSTTLGAVAGPNLVDVMGNIAHALHIPELAGPFILSGAAFLLAGITLLIFLRPDPFIIAYEIAQTKTAEKANDTEPVVAEVNRGVTTGAIVMMLSHVIMIAIMTMTPVYMESFGHSLRAIGLVIGFHIGAMYLPSLFTGILVDKIGRPAMAVASSFTLLLAGLVAALAPGESLLAITIALVLLGLGWNFGLISGTALIVDSTNQKVRAKTQGAIDVFIALLGAIGGGLSGMIVAGASFKVLSIGGGFLSLLLIPVVILFIKRK